MSDTDEVRVFNYPWSGRLGRIAERCPWCGTTGSKFELSSRLGCLDCSTNDTPMLPGEEEALKAKSEFLAREWCKKNELDYDKVVAHFHSKYGEIWQVKPVRTQVVEEDTIEVLKAL